MYPNDVELGQLFSKTLWDSLELPPAVRPLNSIGGSWLQRGYSQRTYRDPESEITKPVLIIAEHKDRLFKLFLRFLKRLQAYTDGLTHVILQTSHYTGDGSQSDVWADEQDVFVLPSILTDWEEYFLADGCAGVAVCLWDPPIEVKIDEHKLIFVYPGSTDRLWHCIGLLRSWGLPEIQGMRCLSEIEHVHSSSEDLAAQFYKLCQVLGTTPDDS